MKPKLGVLLLSALLLLLVTSCGDDKSPPTPVPSATATSPSSPRSVPTASSDAFSAALLTAADLGGDWQQRPVAETGATVADSYYCGRRVSAPEFDATAIFVNPPNQRLFLLEAISRLEDAPAATLVLDRLDAAHSACSESTSTDGVSRSDWQIDSFSRVDLGDEAFAEEASGIVDGAPDGSTSVMVIMRHAKTLILIVEVAEDVIPLAEGMDVATKALAKYVASIDP